MSSQASSSSQNASLKPQLPRCGMNDLPTEIKARIVELCAQQDERFKVELAKAGRPMPKSESRGRPAQQGRSLRALFRVSREFSLLAAPYLFQALDITFKCLVRRRSNLFKELRLDDLDMTKLTDVVGVLPSLSRLQVMHLDRQAVDRLWNYQSISLNPLSLSHATAQYAAYAFGHLEGISKLECDSLSVTSLTALTSRYEALTVLDLKFDSSFGDEGMLADALSGARSLVALAVTTSGEYGPRAVFDTTPAHQQAMPSLRKLSISTAFLHPNHLTFAACFAATLGDLSFSVWYGYEDGSPFPLPAFSLTAFPSLTRFSLSGFDGLTNSALNSITPKLFPALAFVELDSSHIADCDLADDFPLASLASLPRLTTLHLLNLDSLSTEALAALKDFCAENGLNVQVDPPAIDPREPPASGMKTVSSWRAKSIRTTLVYLEEQVAKAEAAGSGRDFLRIENSLAAVESTRVTDKIWEAV
ncbi:hypothetical protein JCM6882_001497 [Rhodosporidiobolus microsporus]